MSTGILRSASPLVHLGISCLICILLATTAMAQERQHSAQNEDLQFRPPRVQLPQNIQYSAWRKLCFKGSDGATLCRTTSTGTEDAGEVVVRVDLIERPDGGVARLQLFVPQGLNLAMGVKATVDQAAPTKIPYNFCLTSSTIAMNVPLNQFAAAHKGPPAETYDYNLDEN